MSAYSLLPIQAGVVAALKADATVTGLVSTRIYDSTEQPAGGSVTFPYCQVTVADFLPNDTVGTEGADVTVTIDVWSRNAGQTVEAHQIAGAVQAALHRQEASITVTGHTLILSNVEFVRVLRDPDGITAHGIVRCNILTEPA